MLQRGTGEEETPEQYFYDHRMLKKDGWLFEDGGGERYYAIKHAVQWFGFLLVKATKVFCVVVVVLFVSFYVIGIALIIKYLCMDPGVQEIPLLVNALKPGMNGIVGS